MLNVPMKGVVSRTFKPNRTGRLDYAVSHVKIAISQEMTTARRR
jgi:hypothetical protein